MPTSQQKTVKGGTANQNQSSDLLLTWDALTSASQYDIEISDASDFSSVIESATVVNATEYQTTNLLAGTIYYWRVKPENTCLAGNFGEIYVFQTANDVCNTYDNGQAWGRITFEK